MAHVENKPMRYDDVSIQGYSVGLEYESHEYIKGIIILKYQFWSDDVGSAIKALEWMIKNLKERNNEPD